MNIDIITIFPDIFKEIFSYSIISRAKQKGLCIINIHNLRDYTTNKHLKVDDAPFGGEAGMVLNIEPIDRCINHLKKNNNYDEIIYLSPDGEILNQSISNKYSLYKNIILLCGHYKGVDERVREHLITKEISIGEYVLSGGELPAMIFCDSIIRLIPGVLGDETSALTDSYQDGLISAPVYTRPSNYNGWEVPSVLLSGNKAKIDEWKLNESIKRTKFKYKK